MRQALSESDPPAHDRRWYADEPFADEGADSTYVLSNQWGTNTEPTLAALVAAFPKAGVTFQLAD